MASALRKGGRAQEALPHYQAAETLNPGQPARHINLAADLAESGHLQDAIAEYQIAAELTDQPRTLARLYESIAALSAAIGDYNTVRESYKQELPGRSAAPSRDDRGSDRRHDGSAHTEGFYSLGFLLQQAGNVPEAREAYVRALNLDPNLTEAKDASNALGAAGTNRAPSQATIFLT